MRQLAFDPGSELLMALDHTSISPDLTFRQSEIDPVIRDYVCAVCHLDLAVQYIPNHERVFIVCPDHGNVCLSGRVMRSTVSIQMENSVRDYYTMLSALPDLFGNIWMNGIPRDQASRIAHVSVCALCGSPLAMQCIWDEDKRKILPDIVSLMCSYSHGNVGLNGIGFVHQSDYIFVPPVEIRRVERLRRDLPQKQPLDFSKHPKSAAFEKLGVISFGNGLESNRNGSDHFRVMVSNRNYPTLAKQFGKELARLTVRLPSPSITASLHTSLECYRKGAMIAKAVRVEDGSFRWEYYRDPDTHEIDIRGGRSLTLAGLRMSNKGVDLDVPIYKDSKGEGHPLQRVARMRLVIPELAELNGSPVTGYFEMSFKDDDTTVIEEGVRIAKQQGNTEGLMLNETPLTLSLRDGRVYIQKGE